MSEIKTIFIIVIYLFLGSVNSQAAATKNTKAATSFIEQVLINEHTPAKLISKHTQSIAYAVAHFKKKKNKFNSDSQFLEYLFYKVHTKFLKNYKPYDTFQNMLNKGVYGCLTATALYAVLLDKLGFEYNIIETNYHIYLLVNTAHGKILMESTDPLNGFVSDETKAANSIKSTLALQVAKENEYQANINICKEIELKELIGLQYYNQAANAYNHQNLNLAAEQLHEAIKYYPSQRTKALAQLIELNE